MLSKLQLLNVCLLYSGDHKKCRYLSQDHQDYNKWYCIKHKPAEKDKVDQTIQDFISDCKKKGLDPYSQGVALGDNCAGYPVLRYIEQGYDKDKN